MRATATCVVPVLLPWAVLLLELGRSARGKAGGRVATTLALLAPIGLVALLMMLADVAVDGDVAAALLLLLLAVLMALWLTPSLRGNQWCARELARRGFRLADTVVAASADAAVRMARGRR